MALRTKQVKARKEYECDQKDSFELFDIIEQNRETKAFAVNVVNAKKHGLTDAEILELEAYIACGFKIQKGELYNYTTGTYDGLECCFRTKINIQNIIHEHELYND